MVLLGSVGHDDDAHIAEMTLHGRGPLLDVDDVPHRLTGAGPVTGRVLLTPESSRVARRKIPDQWPTALDITTTSILCGYRRLE